MYFDDDKPQSPYESPSMQAALGLYLPSSSDDTEDMENEPETVILLRQPPAPSGSLSVSPPPSPRTVKEKKRKTRLFNRKNRN